MKSFIQQLLKQRLSEVTFSNHFYERSEDRIWGNKPQGPASINKGAWAGKYVEMTDITAWDEDTRKLYVEKNVPVTESVKLILAKIKMLGNVIFSTDRAVAVKLWAGREVHTGKDISAPGGTLIVIIRGDVATNTQWQPNKDANISGGKITGVDELISFEELMAYIKQTGNYTITNKDLETMRGLKTGAPIQAKPAEPVINVNGSKYIIANKDGDLKAKNSDKMLSFDDLPEDIQMKVLELMG